MASRLFEPVKWRELELPNRVVIAPMCQYSADGNGAATDWHLLHLGQLALSGAGLLILEATAVEPDGRISPDDLGLWDDRTEAALKRVIDSVRRYSPMPLGIQLAHAGRKASTRVPWEGGHHIRPDEPTGWRTWAPSPVGFMHSDVEPQELDEAGLARVRDAFVEAARRSERLGFDMIEVHAAHGYLLHQFLSPLSNRREDAYGGSLENRMRFPLEVFEAVRAVWPAHKPISVRISATDWVEGGWDLEQSVVFAQALKELGLDVIHVSTGGLSPEQKITVGAGYQTAFAERIRRETGLLTITVGLITEAHQAEHILVSGQADMVGIARAALYDPRWPWHAAAELGGKVHAPNQYLRSQPRHLKDLFG
ncbi:NADH:flavin oxidoreductase/NADH oxidase [Phenylobacterium deserti]|uniref:Oxidoreductase n=1 Tax=Phenylobacterium deserti TaxID=1914756 RepID=A0A328AQH1_9CAUL|nr:NADH:flavin oxidoreductase/NADH oxidase [Phenylobacterium deserti]RAK56819.1 oxidoreductase [Phenylobacterium deserti]